MMRPSLPCTASTSLATSARSFGCRDLLPPRVLPFVTHRSTGFLPPDEYFITDGPVTLIAHRSTGFLFLSPALESAVGYGHGTHCPPAPGQEGKLYA